MKKVRRDDMPPGWGPLRKRILVRDNYVCYLCGKAATTVDHLQPISKGGSVMNPSNLAACCRHCNNKKHATWHDKPIQTIYW
jgi:5-methylcytosine-specific restriction endonuclease McrA